MESRVSIIHDVVMIFIIWLLILLFWKLNSFFSLVFCWFWKEEEKPHSLPHSPLLPPLHSQNHHNNHKDHPLIGKIEYLRKEERERERDDLISFFSFSILSNSHSSLHNLSSITKIIPIHLHLFHFHLHFFVSYFEINDREIQYIEKHPNQKGLYSVWILDWSKIHPNLIFDGWRL